MLQGKHSCNHKLKAEMIKIKRLQFIQFLNSKRLSHFFELEKKTWKGFNNCAIFLNQLIIYIT